MNEANVKALAEILKDARGMLNRTESAPLVEPVIADMLAERLAGRGVLVPSALTDEEATTSPPFDGEWMSISHQDRIDAAARHRAALEQIAKGTA